MERNGRMGQDAVINQRGTSRIASAYRCRKRGRVGQQVLSRFPGSGRDLRKRCFSMRLAYAFTFIARLLASTLTRYLCLSSKISQVELEES
jgi:hypothetical protein